MQIESSLRFTFHYSIHDCFTNQKSYQRRESGQLQKHPIPESMLEEAREDPIVPAEQTNARPLMPAEREGAEPTGRQLTADEERALLQKILARRTP